MNPEAQLSPEIAAKLAELKDIHLPEAVSWWPLAPGWWVLIGLVAAAIVALIVAAYLRRRTVRYRALKELESLRRRSDVPVGPAALAIEILLKRVVLQRAHLSPHASAHGAEWVDILSAEPGGMPKDIARYIAEAPYAALAANENDAPDRDALFSSARRWIRRHT